MTIVEKIKALLAKAASTDSTHEAELFLAKAHELMEKHQLDASDLDNDDPVDAEHFYEKGSVKAAPDWDTNLIWPLATYFGCKACRIYTKNRKWAMDLVGRESARITTMEMHAYLVKTVRRLGREAAGTEDFRAIDRRGNIYYMNADQCARRIGNALRSRLVELNAANAEHAPQPETKAGANALVTLDRVVALYQDRHPDAKNVGGTYYTTNKAEEIAAGIGLNRQAGHSATLRLR